MKRILCLVLIAMSVASCASFFGETTEEPATIAPPEAKQDKPVTYQAGTRDLELKLSKLYARVDELESEIIRQKERTKLLEKGLLTGLPPDELLGKKPSAELPEKPAVDTTVAVVPVKETVATPPPAPASPPPAPPAPSQKDEEAFQEKLSRAHALFGGENWGQAINAYAALGAEFPEEVTKGQHLYWIGVSWVQLKEFQLAQKHLQEFVTRFATNPFVPKAKFYLAKADYQMGMVERAVEGYKVVIREFPADEAAKMAKWEMSKLEEAL